MRVIGGLATLATALLLAGCGGDKQAPDGEITPAQATAAPTSAPTSAPTTEPATPTSPPPTWTPPPGALTSAPGEAGPGLPPTWTPRAQIMPPVAPGPSPTRPPSRPTWTPLPDWCYELQAIAAPGISYTNLPVILSWAPAPNVAQYRVELRNPGGSLLLAAVTAETEYTFGGDLFEVANVYGWQVTPLDENGQPVCYALADEIVVRVPPS